MDLLRPVLGLSEAFLEAVLLSPKLQDLLLLRGKVDGLRDWLHHGVQLKEESKSVTQQTCEAGRQKNK